MDPRILEQIAMYVVSLPCPPLPVFVNIEDFENPSASDTKSAEKEEEATRTICSSHDLLAGLVLGAMQKKDKAGNEQRKQKQIEITRAFIEELKKEEVAKSRDKLFDACKKFTAEYIFSFDDPNTTTPSIVFGDMSDVCVGDKIHKACASWHVSQEILYGDKGNKRDINHFQYQTYAQLIQEHCSRITAAEPFSDKELEVIAGGDCAEEAT